MCVCYVFYADKSTLGVVSVYSIRIHRDGLCSPGEPNHDGDESGTNIHYLLSTQEDPEYDSNDRLLFIVSDRIGSPGNHKPPYQHIHLQPRCTEMPCQLLPRRENILLLSIY
eukprot:sb/3477098/